ncbi:IcmT/TraK family protein [Acetobacter sp. UBA5411]|uniref:IcmT/TraK family protein n=1 Tax=Acetobacter sp. UBA5411 TaxID=1945905 RepID=UPI0025C5DC10|nr:IcmT/TraK family protein [Acetobacter sp. UBA5411]
MWRATGLPVRILFLDGSACLPMLISISYWSWTTLIIGVVGTLFFGTISFFGLTPITAWRCMRRFLCGRLRTARPTWKRRRYG